MTFFIATTSAVLACAISLWVAWKEKNTLIRWSFVGGLTLLALEAIFIAIKSDAIFPDQKAYWQSWTLVAKSFMPGTWLIFSLTYARGNYREFLKRWRYFVGPAAVLLPVITVCFRDRIFSSATVDAEGGVALGLTLFGMILYFCFLVSAILVVMNFERTFRASVGTMRWRIKYMIIGLALLFGIRAYTSSQYILYQSIQPSLEIVNVSAFGVACLFVLRSLFRAGYFEVNVYPSQAVLQHSFTFAVAGIYLVLVGLFAKAVTYFGGANAFPLKAFFILVAMVVLTLLLFSDRVRLQTRYFISRNFQRPLYNYRTVWRSFTEKTGAGLDQSELCRSIIKLLADIFEVLSVTIWVVDADEKLRLAGSSSVDGSGAELSNAEMAEVIRGLKTRHEPVDIDSSKERWTEALRKIHPSEFRKGGHRLCVPMIAAGELQGVITLGDRVSGLPFSSQDIDLLKCAGDQAAASLLNIQLSKKLVQAKELEAFQTMSAFFVHDLKNTASTLSLMLQNLPTHFNDPAFREDALRGVSKSVHHIDDLIKRLTLFRQKAVTGMKEAELNKLVEGVLSDVTLEPAIKIRKNLRDLPRQVFDPEELGKVVTNLILNARDALTGAGEIHVETSQQSGWSVLSVADNGCGMSREFARDALFRPFQTTKKNGIGIGMFQSKMIVEAHRGRIEVETELGKGTTFRVLLPLKQEAK